MCLSDTEKGFQMQKRLNNPSLIGAPKCRERHKFLQAGTGMGGDMERRGKIPGYRQNFYKYKIQPGDTTLLLPNCRGFIHGGKMMYLPDIMCGAGECLKCSNVIRDEGGTRARDNTSQEPNGEGVYFRFIPQNIPTKKILRTVTGPGASGGVFLCVRTQDSAGFEFFTMNSNDIKYSLMNSWTAREKGTDESALLVDRMKRAVDEVKRQILRAGGGINNSEIAFYRQVPFSAVGEVFLLQSSKDSSKMWNVDRNKYLEVYRICHPGASLPKLKMSYPVAPAEMLVLLEQLLRDKGFTKVGDVIITKGGRRDVYQRYVRPSHNLFPLNADSSAPSVPSGPSAPAGPSDSGIL